MSRPPRVPGPPGIPFGGRVALGTYGMAAGAAVAVARTLLRGVGEAERVERLGTAAPPCGPGRLLLHAVSAGEMTAASALVSELERTTPGLKLLLTTGTREGRVVAEQVHAACRAVDAVSYLPWDRPAAIRRWLARLAPSAVVTVEAELWPGLFLCARSLGIPIAVASGRLRPGEARRYAFARPVFRPVVEAVSWIGARTEEDRERFLAIGASPSRVEVTGDLKLDAPAPSAALPPGWEDFACGPPLFLGASTHAPEEELLLAVLGSLREEGVAVRLVLAPRHVSRGNEIERLARQAGFETRRLSGPPGPADVLVVDVFGLLPALWPSAAIGFLGGTLAPVGGHSPVGAAEAGVPLLAGPSLDGVRDVAEALRSAGALVEVGGAGAVAGLAAAAARLLDDEGDRRRRGDAGRRALGSLRGAAARTAARVLALLAAR